MAHKSKKGLEIFEITYTPEIVTQIPQKTMFFGKSISFPIWPCFGVPSRKLTYPQKIAF